ncbi:hypothetical protein [Prevotella sp. KH2C16]|uniref:hypothetical protein n=1 Tax=Prevotella sp. KH2C16 TaxID=1855325 RepID=UPI0008E9FC56|nr:hypothetical protein [Prevotella sp. KH2C16]SFG38072.1 hypothetical protein SAMN05216383_1126 [Prevotella sp. KH2C16]SFG75632.1 hypothetical protein SAMN05216383_13916 [Prevotella sp. KH2C16]
MKKIKEFFGDMSHWYHIVACLVIAAVVALVSKSLWSYGGETELFANAACGFIGFVAATCCGVAKEVVDFFRYGRFDAKDLLADLVGAAVAFLFALGM